MSVPYWQDWRGYSSSSNCWHGWQDWHSSWIFKENRPRDMAVSTLATGSAKYVAPCALKHATFSRACILRVQCTQYSELVSCALQTASFARHVDDLDRVIIPTSALQKATGPSPFKILDNRRRTFFFREKQVFSCLKIQDNTVPLTLYKGVSLHRVWRSCRTTIQSWIVCNESIMIFDLSTLAHHVYEPHQKGRVSIRRPLQSTMTRRLSCPRAKAKSNAANVQLHHSPTQEREARYVCASVHYSEKIRYPSHPGVRRNHEKIHLWDLI